MNEFKTRLTDNFNLTIGKFKAMQIVLSVSLKQSGCNSPVYRSTHNSVTRREEGAKDHEPVERAAGRS